MKNVIELWRGIFELELPLKMKLVKKNALRNKPETKY